MKKIGKLEFIKNEHFCSLKFIIKKMDVQITGQEKVFAM